MTKTLKLNIKVEMTEDLFADGDLTLDDVNQKREREGLPSLSIGDYDDVQIIVNEVPQEVTNEEVIVQVAGAYDVSPELVTVAEEL